MTKKQNLHFLLALGNTKIVVLKENEQLHLYSSNTKHTTIDSSRLTDALNAR